MSKNCFSGHYTIKIMIIKKIIIQKSQQIFMEQRYSVLSHFNNAND